MKFVILVLFCVFSCHRANPLNGSDPVLINSKPEQIPEVTTEEIKSALTNSKIEGVGPFESSSTTPTTTATANTTTTPTTTIPTPTTTIPTHITTISTPITTIPTPTTTIPTPTTTNHTLPTSTATSTTLSSTVTPSTPTPGPTSRPTTQPVNRGFDGPSFIGGIVLAAGLMAIGFVAFKFYKARTELNYHTL